LDVPVFAATLTVMFASSDRAAIWSPYHYITVSRVDTPNVTEADPPPDLLTMKDPPVYSVSINQLYYHFDGAFYPERYTPGSRLAVNFINPWLQYYRLPYALAKGRDRVLALGAGGGGDVEGARGSRVG